MAGPLNWFRKNQKLLLGVFGVLLIFTFTISLGSGVDPIVDYFSGGGGSMTPSNPVVVSWKQGKMKRSDFSNLRRGRVLMNNFLSAVLMRTEERGGQPQTFALPSATNDESLMRLVVLSREAENQQLLVDDDLALDYLQRLSGGTILKNELGQLLQTVTQGQLADRQVLALLKRELLAQKLVAMARSGTTPATPVASWDFFNRLERQLSAEMVPIAVDDFVDDVEDPSESDVKAFYEKYKDRFSSPMDPDPGFKQRKKIAFQFVQANYEAFLKTAEEDVTDDDIAKFYEDNQDEFMLEEQDEEEGLADEKESDDTNENEEEAETDQQESDDKSESAGEDETDEKESDDTNESAGEDEADDEQESGESDLDATEEEAEPAKYKPLDEVKSDIRTRLARPTAQSLMDEALSKARQRIEGYYKENVYWEIQKAKDPNIPRPEFPDFSDLGTAEQVKFDEIPLVDPIEVQQHGLGQAYELNLLENRVQRISFAEMAFSDNLPNYKSREIPAYEIDCKFLFWKTDEAEPRIPELDEIRDAVVLRWKQQKAVDKAMTFADEQAEIARGANKSLAQCDIDLAGRTIVQTGDISWMTGGNVPMGGGGAPRLGSIPGVPGAGFEFMKTVFRTPRGGICVAIDEPKENVYLVRVESTKPDDTVRRDGFNEMGAELPGLHYLARLENSRFVNDWVEELLDRYEVDWKSDPNSQGDE